MKTLRSTLRFSTAALSVLLLSGLPNIALLASESYPTAKVNTTGLAVTDTEVTVGQLHSATGTMAIPNACATVWLPTEIFDFDITPCATGPKKMIKGKTDLAVCK